jgi:peptidyl-prolyl isomerase D
MPNTITYFDITIGGKDAGRITFELFDDVVPKVCCAGGSAMQRTDSRPLRTSSTSVLETRPMRRV